MLPSRNPDLRMLDREIEASGKMVALARKERLPDPEFGIGWMMARDEGSADMPGGNRDPLMLMIGMELPLSFGRYRAAEKEAVAGRGAAELERKDRLNSLQAGLQEALFEYRDAGRKVELYREALIPKAEQSWLPPARDSAREKLVPRIDRHPAHPAGTGPGPRRITGEPFPESG